MLSTVGTWETEANAFRHFNGSYSANDSQSGNILPLKINLQTTPNLHYILSLNINLIQILWWGNLSLFGLRQEHYFMWYTVGHHCNSNTTLQSGWYNVTHHMIWFRSFVHVTRHTGHVVALKPYSFYSP